MVQYSQSQIASLAASVGFKDTNMASSVAMAESGGVTDRIGPVGEIGLWQIYLQAHPQYTAAQMRDPVQNAKAAYAISNGGTNWRAWCTAYSDGACGTKGGSYLGSGSPYQKFLGKGGSTTPTSTTLPTLDHKPWWQFPRIDNMGQPDTFGGFPKPDSNIQIPAGYPVEALLPGTVSGINSSSSYSTVITIKLDKPLNSLATHTFYEHLRGDVSVRVGQHVNTGQLIAHNGASQATGSEKVPLGFGLYNGDNYAFGPAWQLMTRSNLNGGPLDPVPLLNQAAKGSIPNLPSGSGSGTSSSDVGSATGSVAALAQVVTTRIETVSQAAYDKINHLDGFMGICEALDIAETFVPFYLPTKAQQDINTISGPQTINVFGFDTGVGNPVALSQTAQAALQLPADSIQAILVFATTNFMAFTTRSLFVSIGLILGTALIINAVSSIVDIKDVAQFAAMAA